QAAQLLRCEIGAIQMRLLRARNLLRSRLTRRGVTLPACGLAAFLAGEGIAMALPVALVMPVIEAAKGIGAGQTAAAISPAAGALRSHVLELAEAILRVEISRRWLLRCACGLAALGLAAGAIAFWHSPNPRERTGQRQELPAENARVFDSALPLLVMDRRAGHRGREIGRTPTLDGRGLRIPAGSE